jgi:hypothetical protein
MSAGTYNITIEKRASFSFSATITNSDGSPYDLTSRTLYGQIRRNWDNGLQAELTVVETDAANGVIAVSLTEDQTSALTLDDSTYDIFADADNGSVAKKILTGTATIVRNYTEQK